MTESVSAREGRPGIGGGGGGQGGAGKQRAALSTQPWYWPNATRKEIDSRMAGESHGSFLIRDCSVPGDFTLTIKIHGCTKCVRIFNKEEMYSLYPTDSGGASSFSSLAELVEFYKRNSLSCFNTHLDVRLQRAVHKPLATSFSQYGVFKELYDLSQSQLTAQTRLSVLEQQHSQLDKNVKTLSLMVPALKVVQRMYKDNLMKQTEIGPMRSKSSMPVASVQQDLPVDGTPSDMEDMEEAASAGQEDSLNMSRSLSREEEKGLTSNIRLLMSRHSALSDKLHSARSHFDMDFIKIHELEAELQNVKHSLLKMKRRENVLIRQMLDLGSAEDYLNQVLEERVATQEFDRSTWLVRCSRDEALERLKDLPPGAFLVRPKDKSQLPFVLSIVTCPESGPCVIQHCYIVRPKGRGYGFNASLAVFESIDQLVLRHRNVSLKHYFSNLDVSLDFPVGCQELLRQSSISERESVVALKGVYANASAVAEAQLERDLYEPVNYSCVTLESSKVDPTSKPPVHHPYEYVVPSRESSQCVNIRESRNFPQDPSADYVVCDTEQSNPGVEAAEENLYEPIDFKGDSDDK